MYSTVQQKAYFVPTAKRSSHHSQMPFDSSVSLTVKPMSRQRIDDSNNWKKNYGRSCWTADASQYQQRHTSNSKPIIIHAQPGYRRSYTTMGSDSTHSMAMPSTAALPRRGQIKLTALHQQITTPHSYDNRAKTVGAAGGAQRRQRTNERGGITAGNRREPRFGNLGELTVADLQTVINTEFPETQGLAFNRASQYIRTATAELMKNHSRPISQASRGRSSTPSQLHNPLPEVPQAKLPPTTRPNTPSNKEIKTDSTVQTGAEGRTKETTDPKIAEEDKSEPNAVPVVNIPTS